MVLCDSNYEDAVIYLLVVKKERVEAEVHATQSVHLKLQQSLSKLQQWQVLRQLQRLRQKRATCSLQRVSY